MNKIKLLSQETIDKIAAGEVVERPRSVVKELVENAIDAGASAITVEIKNGGISLVRITDNGSGIPREEIPLAFLRHSTSKIRSAEDLVSVHSLGFRGEALSSISAVARVELITKTYDSITGTRYLIEGSKEIANEEIGAPEGTTFIVKDLFFNTPARRKFLKSATTEGNYITDLMEKLAMSHPDISFKFISNNKTKLHTSGNSNIRDLVYQIYGREIASSTIEVNEETELFKIKGFLGKPVITRGNRNYENYFINSRYIKSPLLSKAIEEGYKNYLMQHQYPFTLLYFEFDGELLDVNVHPTKMELRFSNNEQIYKELYDIVYSKLSQRELIPSVPVDERDAQRERLEERLEKEARKIPEPFEINRANAASDLNISVNRANASSKSPNPVDFAKGFASEQVSQAISAISNALEKVSEEAEPRITLNLPKVSEEQQPYNLSKKDDEQKEGKPKESEQLQVNTNGPVSTILNEPAQKFEYKEMTLADMDRDFLRESNKVEHKIIGQLFKTYWLIEYKDELFIIDQHAAHEKVLYERTMKKLKDKEFTSQIVSPPIILTLDSKESEALEQCREQIEEFGYEIENFGGKEYVISAIPANLYNMNMKDLFIEMLDDFSNLSGKATPDMILEKVATMSCKAAVKGNNKLSLDEINELFDELMTLDNPYNCPHGRPTIIKMSKQEIEKKFKRII
ncbi:DNA mismatch repair protein MutL [Lachnospiraceae bacterium C7]|nr:DNA mismatch repair protein MutL [Lachnospiraceae bacterium C7]